MEATQRGVGKLGDKSAHCRACARFIRLIAFGCPRADYIGLETTWGSGFDLHKPGDHPSRPGVLRISGPRSWHSGRRSSLDGKPPRRSSAQGPSYGSTTRHCAGNEIEGLPEKFLTTAAAWNARESVRACVALAVGLFSASCSPPQEAPITPTVVRDSAGVEIVLDVGVPLWLGGEGLRVSNQPVVQIGTIGEGKAALYLVRDALRLEDGTIAVANAGSSEIRFFGATGEFLYSAGRPGDAPGEFQDLRRLGLRAVDSLLLAFDYNAQRVTEFLSTGVLLRTVPLPSHPSDTRAVSGRELRLSAVGWLHSGALVVSGVVSAWDVTSRQDGEGLATNRSTVQLYFFDRDGRNTPFGDQFAGDERVARFSLVGGGLSVGSVPVPFLKTFHVASGGEGVVAGNTGVFDIRAYDALGRLVRIIRRPDALHDVDADARRAWIDRQLSDEADPTVRNRRRRQYEEMKFPSTLPTFRSLLLAEDGRLWVEEFDPSAASSDESNWTVYDRRGYSFGQVAMPPRFRPFEIGEDYVLGVWRDDSEVEYVRLYNLTSREPG